MDFYADRSAVVTGGAGGFGRALVGELLRRKARVAALDIDAAALRRLRADFSGAGPRLSVHPTDVSRPDSVKKTARAVLRLHGSVAVLINNAGVSISQPFLDLAPAAFRRLFEINFWAAVYCTRAFLPALQAQPAARIANIGSDFGLFGFPGKTSYSASKSALLGFTNSLAAELNDARLKISYVIPPPLDTNLVRGGLHVDEARRANEVRFLETRGMRLERAAQLARFRRRIDFL
jgi:NAD(P)-dependent dehydrogenase (short-subunit alcohol dehydrogenase family)